MSIQARNKSSGTLEQVAGFSNVDAILSPTSINPPQSKTVYNALAQKIEKTVNDLVNYYDKSQVYNKTEVRALIGAINTLTIEVVPSLPTTDISSTTIYFVGPATGTNTYDEYVYVGNTWVKIGDTDVDLSEYVTNANLTTILQDYYTKSAVDALLANYYTKSEADALLNAKQDTLTFDDAPTQNSGNPVKSGGVYNALAGKQNTLTFDTAPTSGSNNPVTSDGIKTAIDAVQNDPPIDAVTDGSMNPVTSNAVWDQLYSLFRPLVSTVNVNTNIDLNNCTTGGFANFLISPTNSNSCGSYGYLLVLRYGSSSSPNICQIHFPYHGGDKFAIRCRFGGSWTSWKSFGVV